jgi:exosortase/archaeosortase family protein
VDSETGGSQVAISLLFLICIIPPFGLDNWLITWLQQVSARITSQLLDLVGYAHYMPGTVIEAPGSKGFGIEEACSGVQSFFTLLFVALLYVVYYRRPWFRASLLLASVAFWSVFMNTMRIFVIPIAERVADWDLSKDLAHDILGYTALIIGMLLLYSTDQFLLFLFGPAEDFSDDAGGLSRSVTRFWNRFASGASQENRRKKTKKSLNQSAFVVLWAIAGLLAVGGLFSLTDVYKSLNTPGLKVQFFDSSVLVPLEKDAIPAEIEDWRQVNYTYQDRSRGSDLGQYSDTWIFVAPKFGLATASLDQAFPGWHELTTCYKNQGWELIDRKVFAGTREGSDVRWPYVEAEFRNKLGQHGFLVFSLFDGMGDAYEPPSNWSAITYLVNGVSNRMNNRVRSRLFRGEAYQTQAFVSTYREFDRELKDHIVERYMTIRDLLREDFLKKSGTLSGNSESGSPSGPVDAVEPTT